jgi:hypothetical protein
MPASTSCFSNPAGLPPVIGNRDAAQSAQCGWLHCFSYPADVPPGTRTRNAAQSVQSGLLNCFSYPADVPPDPRWWRVAPVSATDRAPAAHPPASI